MVSHQEHPWNLFVKIFSQGSKSENTSQLFYRIIWPHVSSPSELVASNEVTILKLLRRVLSLTSIMTSLPKIMTECGKLVELYLIMTSPLQVTNDSTTPLTVLQCSSTVASLKSDQVFIMPQWYIHETLVLIRPLVHEIFCA